MSSRNSRARSSNDPFAYLKVGLLVIVALGAVEKFYRHPTYGTGIAALLAAMQAGEAL